MLHSTAHSGTILALAVVIGCSSCLAQTTRPTPLLSEVDIVPTGLIDYLDLYLLASDWKEATGPEGSIAGDIDRSSEVDANDLVGLLGQWHRQRPEALEMVTLPAGSFLMGNSESSRDEEYALCLSCETPRHEVTIDYSFLIGKYEITNEKFAEVLNWAHDRGYLTASAGRVYSGGDVYHEGHLIMEVGVLLSDIVYVEGRFVPRLRNGKPTDLHPVKKVTWFGAIFFCNSLSAMEGLIPAYYLPEPRLVNANRGGYRLPSESEWEYACRGPADDPNRYSPFSFGDDPDLEIGSCAGSVILNRYMVWCGNQTLFSMGGWTEEIGSRRPNGFGLHDMHGNVWEWCGDSYHSSYSQQGRPDDGAAWGSTGSLIRGGSWESSARLSRTASRALANPNVGTHHIGFRVARFPMSAHAK